MLNRSNSGMDSFILCLFRKADRCIYNYVGKKLIVYAVYILNTALLFTLATHTLPETIKVELLQSKFKLTFLLFQCP